MNKTIDDNLTKLWDKARGYALYHMIPDFYGNEVFQIIPPSKEKAILLCDKQLVVQRSFFSEEELKKFGNQEHHKSRLIPIKLTRYFLTNYNGKVFGYAVDVGVEGLENYIKNTQEEQKLRFEDFGEKRPITEKESIEVATALDKLLSSVELEY